MAESIIKSRTNEVVYFPERSLSVLVSMSATGIFRHDYTDEERAKVRNAPTGYGYIGCVFKTDTYRLCGVGEHNDGFYYYVGDTYSTPLEIYVKPLFQKIWQRSDRL